MTVESQYDPTRIKRAETVLKQILSEHGHQFATIKTEVKTIPPASVQVNFNVKEGPVVKVGQIKFTGNQHLSSLTLRRSMKNLKPLGIPHSVIFEDIFPPPDREPSRFAAATRAGRRPTIHHHDPSADFASQPVSLSGQ